MRSSCRFQVSGLGSVRCATVRLHVGAPRTSPQSLNGWAQGEHTGVSGHRLPCARRDELLCAAGAHAAGHGRPAESHGSCGVWHLRRRRPRRVATASTPDDDTAILGRQMRKSMDRRLEEPSRVRTRTHHANQTAAQLHKVQEHVTALEGRPAPAGHSASSSSRTPPRGSGAASEEETTTALARPLRSGCWAALAQCPPERQGRNASQEVGADVGTSRRGRTSYVWRVRDRCRRRGGIATSAWLFWRQTLRALVGRGTRSTTSFIGRRVLAPGSGWYGRKEGCLLKQVAERAGKRQPIGLDLAPCLVGHRHAHRLRTASNTISTTDYSGCCAGGVQARPSQPTGRYT